MLLFFFMILCDYSCSSCHVSIKYQPMVMHSSLHMESIYSGPYYLFSLVLGIGFYGWRVLKSSEEKGFIFSSIPIHFIFTRIDIKSGKFHFFFQLSRFERFLLCKLFANVEIDFFFFIFCHMNYYRRLWISFCLVRSRWEILTPFCSSNACSVKKN